MSLRARVMSAVARRYLGRSGRLSFDTSKLRLLPDGVLMPLQRTGLDPVAALGRARERTPVVRVPMPFGPPLWLVTGYPQAKTVLADGDGFSTNFARLLGDVPGLTAGPGGLGFADPPVHTRLRRLLTPEFTMRRLARLTPLIRDIVDVQLDAMAGGGPVDLVRDFALPIPSLVICELLGVPYADRERFQRLAMDRFDVFSGLSLSFGAISESLQYFREVVRRQRRTPGDGLIGMILAEHGDEIDDEELAGLADGVLTGGFETTASMLALGSLVLLTDAGAFRRIHDDDAAAGPFVEELLRHLSVVQVAFPRIARRDVTIAGVDITAGDVVIVSLAGANRDRALADGLDVIDSARSPLSHLAFGHGIHRCIGAELARMELRAAYPALVRRFPRMRLAVDVERLNFRKASIVYGIDNLPVHVDLLDGLPAVA
ncbi:MAG TPA: cytochrome P450 [Micromonosporaceae bacterium]|jgi:cytochrome P450